MKNTFAAIKFWMDKILSIACAVLLTFMTVLVLIQVFSRYILNSPVAFTEELVRYSLIWTGFLAQIINIYEDVTGEKVESEEGADK